MRYADDDRVAELQREVAALRARVEKLEGAGQPAQAAQSAAASHPPAAADRPSAGRTATPKLQDIAFEDLLGGRLLAWLGGTAIVLAAVFFLVMAFSRGWIDEPTRVVLAFLGSTMLLGAGLYLYERQGKTQAALAAVASAIAALYASLTAATALYDLVHPAVGLAAAALVGAAATAIAVRWSSPVVAGIGLVGALLSP